MNKSLYSLKSWTKHAWEPRILRYKSAAPTGMKTVTMEEEAISPVIATILLIAITVAIIGGLYVLISHFTSSTTAPLSATITEQSENTNYAVMTLSFSTPSNMTNLAGITVSLTIPGATGGSPTLVSFSSLATTSPTAGATGPFTEQLGGSVFAQSTKGADLSNSTATTGPSVWFGVTFSNVNPGDTSGVQSGALITLYAFYSTGTSNSATGPQFTGKGTSIIYNWSGIAFSLNYKGYSGTAQVTLP